MLCITVRKVWKPIDGSQLRTAFRTTAGNVLRASPGANPRLSAALRWRDFAARWRPCPAASGLGSVRPSKPGFPSGSASPPRIGSLGMEAPPRRQLPEQSAVGGLGRPARDAAILSPTPPFLFRSVQPMPLCPRRGRCSQSSHPCGEDRQEATVATRHGRDASPPRA